MKEKIVYVCENCGYRSIKWLGKCPACGEWNTLKENNVAPKAAVAEKNIVRQRSKSDNKALNLSAIADLSEDRKDSGISELNRVLGGGLVLGELILLSGDPGIGKSTLALQMAAEIAKKETVMYISGEESAGQIKMRANRLGLAGNIFILAQNDLNKAEEELKTLKP